MPKFPTLTARDMVEERADLVRWLEDPSDSGGGHAWSNGLGPQDAWREKKSAPRWAASLRAADLTYVDTALTRTALAAGDAFDDYSLDECDIPSPHGFIAFAEPITAHLSEMEFLTGMPITAASWAVHGSMVEIRWWSDKKEWIKDFSSVNGAAHPKIGIQHITKTLYRLHPTKVVAVGHSALSFTEEPSWPSIDLPPANGSSTFFGPAKRNVVTQKARNEERIAIQRLTEAERTLVAAWALMQQTIVTETIVHAPKAALSRVGRIDPALLGTVRQVTLRHRNLAPDRVGHIEGPKREWAHRWCVKGHWRKRTRPPKPGESRKIWVSWHIKGPDGAPILDPSKLVNVLRR